VGERKEVRRGESGGGGSGGGGDVERGGRRLCCLICGLGWVGFGRGDGGEFGCVLD